MSGRFGKKWNDVYNQYSPKSGLDNGKYAPQNPCRVLITGPSGCGKTQTLLSLIANPDDPDTTMRWTKLYVCAKDLSEPAYEFLKEKTDKMTDLLNEQLAEDGQEADEELAYYFMDPSEFHVDDLDPNEQNIVIFDDCQLELVGNKGLKQMNEFFMRGRKKNCSMFFLAQDFFADNLKFIRGQCDYILMFNPHSSIHANIIQRELGVPKEKFAAASTRAWKENGFVMVDKRHPGDSLGLRCGFYPD
jgi:hypothetical protein